MDVKERLIRLINEDKNARADITSLDGSESLSSLGFSSISIVSFIVAVEQEFGFEFDDEDVDIERFLNVNSLIQYINERIEE